MLLWVKHSVVALKLPLLGFFMQQQIVYNMKKLGKL